MQDQLLKDYREAVALYESGMSLGDIAPRYGISRQGLHQILRRRGVRMRSKIRSGEASSLYQGGGGSKAHTIVHRIVEEALEGGLLTPKPCEECGAENRDTRNGRRSVRAHHDDYSKPLEVRWLCYRCHFAWHRKHTAKHKDAPPRKRSWPMNVGDIRVTAKPALRERIREMGWRQDWLAEQVGVSKATITLWLTKGRSVSLEHALFLANLVDEDIAVCFELAHGRKAMHRSSNGRA